MVAVPRTVAVGSRTAEGVKVLAVDADTATIETDGKRRVLRVGQNVASQLSVQVGTRAVLTTDGDVYFMTTGSINGALLRFIVDTGAAMISLSASEARRIGIDVGEVQAVMVMMANGQASVVLVKLDSVRVGQTMTIRKRY